jgi:arsenite methyltransferase
VSNEQELKELVRQKYSEIALQEKQDNHASCCGATCCSTEVYNIMSEEYTQLEGYHPNADLGLGCGLPTQFAKIKKGDLVIDLGSGAGNDAFVARAQTGPTGKVIGVDFSEAMVSKARTNADKLGFNNVEFRFGDIENMPVTANAADVIVSNCVLNLVPNKDAVLKDIYRVLKPGGHFSISDIVLIGSLPAGLQQSAQMYAGCISGAVQKDDYIELIKKNGFEAINIQKEKVISLPADILAEYLDNEQMVQFQNSVAGIFSLTVFAEKPLDLAPCCQPGCC